MAFDAPFSIDPAVAFMTGAYFRWRLWPAEVNSRERVAHQSHKEWEITI